MDGVELPVRWRETASERDNCDAGPDVACDADVLYPEELLELELGSESDGGRGGRLA